MRKQKPTKKAKSKKRSQKPAKLLSKISTEAALASSTVLSFMIHASSPEFSTAVESKLGSLPPEVRNISIDSDEGLANAQKVFEALKPLIREKAISSCEAAATLLARILWLERIYKRIDSKDPKDIVTCWYCLIRTAEKHGEFKQVAEQLRNQYGENWIWPLVWAIALTNECVRQRSERESAVDHLQDWQEQCQNYARNYWDRKRKSFEIDVAHWSQLLIVRLMRKLSLEKEDTSLKAKQPDE